MNPDSIETRLAQIPLRELPPEWKQAVLARSRRTATPAPLRLNFRDWLWPHPWAWAGVAAAWLLIAGLNCSGPRGGALYAIHPAQRISTEQYAAYVRVRDRFLAQNHPPEPRAAWPPPAEL
ncbi:MAG TPA: hypothetical protein VIS74_08180 [Chthoniobacterales bacterium]